MQDTNRYIVAELSGGPLDGERVRMLKHTSMYEKTVWGSSSHTKLVYVVTERMTPIGRVIFDFKGYEE